MYVLHWFDRELAASPDAPAIVCEGRRLTYRELNAIVSRIAYGLQQAGVVHGDLVAVLLHRAPEMIAALLGIWKVGGTCVPIDPNLPPGRVAFTLQDAAAPFLLTQRDHAAGLAVSAHMLDLDAICCAEPGDWQPLAGTSSGNTLAYVVYTSGSTGRPKGVQITHAGLANTVESVRRDLMLTPEDVVLAWSSLAFDIAFLEICLPLVCGASVYLVEEQRAAGQSRAEQLGRSGATVMLGTPTLYRVLLEEGWPGDPRMQAVVGGEVLPIELARKLASICRTVWNQYGPAETSICATRERIEADAEEVTIGFPLPSVSVHLLGEDSQPVPQGSMGEIYIGGLGVAPGYLNRSELTNSRFLPDPFSSDGRGRLYRTGDLARQLTDGRLTFVGRADSQVKVRGYRIELGEIQSALQRCPGVRAAVVRAIELEPGDQRLIAFVLADIHVPSEIWKQLLGERLPAYMIPSEFVHLSHFPTTPGGKVDLRSLDALRLRRPVQPLQSEVPCTDVTEVALHLLWQRLLKHKTFGIHDDFFSIGGHSLLAAQMLSRAERRFGCKIPHAVLGEAPTIQGLARHIRRAPPKSWPAIVTLQRGEHLPPLFIAHGIGGSVLSFMELTAALDPAQPVYVFQLPPVIAPQDANLSRMAENYLRQMRDRQPCGPYHLAGHSSGGLMVFEMACQLIADGEEVSILALLDCDPDVGRPSPRRLFDWNALGAACKRLLTRFRMREVNVRQWLRRRADYQRIRINTWLAVRARRAGRERGAVRAEGHLALAMGEYELKPYAGRITLFIAQDEPRSTGGPAKAWAARRPGDCDVVLVGGTHLTMLTQPNVAFLSKELQRRIVPIDTPLPSEPAPATALLGERLASL